MNYKIRTVAPFDRQLKPLTKKYPSLRSEIISLIGDLKTDPVKGTPIGNECYKIRLAIASKGRGKSGGARVITYVTIIEESVYLLSIYDKSEHSDINDNELMRLLDLAR